MADNEHRKNSAERFAGSHTHCDFITVPRLMVFPQAHILRHIQKLWWILSYPQRKDLTFMKWLLLSDTEVENGYMLFQVALSSLIFFPLPDTHSWSTLLSLFAGRPGNNIELRPIELGGKWCIRLSGNISLKISIRDLWCLYPFADWWRRKLF